MNATTSPAIATTPPTSNSDPDQEPFFDRCGYTAVFSNVHAHHLDR
jgi:hypothetical protein